MGCFNSRLDAEQFGQQFKESEGYETEVDSFDLFIDNYQDKFEIITTPSSLWKRDGDQVEELFRFDSTSIPIWYSSHDIKAVISPKGNEVVFYFDHKILKIGQNINSAQEEKCKRGVNKDLKELRVIFNWAYKKE